MYLASTRECSNVACQSLINRITNVNLVILCSCLALEQIHNTLQFGPTQITFGMDTLNQAQLDVFKSLRSDFTQMVILLSVFHSRKKNLMKEGS